VELLSWARQDISSAIRVNNIGTSELIRSSSIIKSPCHHQDQQTEYPHFSTPTPSRRNGNVLTRKKQRHHRPQR
jgi:hypothetical protein